MLAKLRSHHRRTTGALKNIVIEGVSKCDGSLHSCPTHHREWRLDHPRVHTRPPSHMRRTWRQSSLCVGVHACVGGCGHARTTRPRHTLISCCCCHLSSLCSCLRCWLVGVRGVDRSGVAADVSPIAGCFQDAAEAARGLGEDPCLNAIERYVLAVALSCSIWARAHSLAPTWSTEVTFLALRSTCVGGGGMSTGMSTSMT